MNRIMTLALLSGAALVFSIGAHAASASSSTSTSTSTSSSTTTTSSSTTAPTGRDRVRAARREANRDFNRAQRDFTQATRQYKRTLNNVEAPAVPAPNASSGLGSSTFVTNSNNSVYDARVLPNARVNSGVTAGYGTRPPVTSSASINGDIQEEALDRYQRAEKRYENAEDRYDDRIDRLDRLDRRYDRNLRSRVTIND